MVQVNVMIHYQLWQQHHQYISLYKDESAEVLITNMFNNVIYLFSISIYIFVDNDFDSIESSHVHMPTRQHVNNVKMSFTTT